MRPEKYAPMLQKYQMVIVRIYCYSPKIVATDLNNASRKRQQRQTKPTVVLFRLP